MKVKRILIASLIVIAACVPTIAHAAPAQHTIRGCYIFEGGKARYFLTHIPTCEWLGLPIVTKTTAR